jgi:hypothetical protein
MKRSRKETWLVDGIPRSLRDLTVIKHSTPKLIRARLKEKDCPPGTELSGKDFWIFQKWGASDRKVKNPYYALNGRLYGVSALARMRNVSPDVMRKCFGDLPFGTELSETRMWKDKEWENTPLPIERAIYYFVLGGERFTIRELATFVRTSSGRTRQPLYHFIGLLRSRVWRLNIKSGDQAPPELLLPLMGRPRILPMSRDARSRHKLASERLPCAVSRNQASGEV